MKGLKENLELTRFLLYIISWLWLYSYDIAQRGLDMLAFAPAYDEVFLRQWSSEQEK